MTILVIDGQGGGLGKQLVGAIKTSIPGAQVIAAGTNSIATGAMVKAGADRGATGENAVVVCSGKADIIVGAVGIVIADSMLGEITPKMAEAVGRSRAVRVLIPVNLCGNIIVGVGEIRMTALIKDAVAEIRALTNG